LVCIEFALDDLTTSGDTTNENDDTTISEKLTSDHETSSGHDHQEDWHMSCVYIDT
jgi:hypothetical protein